MLNLSSLIVFAYSYLFTDFTTRFIFLIGSRKSAKTKHIALRIVLRLLQDKEYNALVMRKVNNTIKDSVKEEIMWAINQLGVSHLFEYKSGFQEFIYLPTGQRILLRSIQVDKSTGKTKLTGLNVSKGFIKDVWLEEAYEFTKADFKMIIQTMRGSAYTMIISMNPWVESQYFVNWAMKYLTPSLDLLRSKGEQFYADANAEEGMGVIVHWTNWMINTKLSKADIQERLREKATDPEEYLVAGYGMPGVVEGAIFSRVIRKIKSIDYETFTACTQKLGGGIDYGDVRDATAATISGYDYMNPKKMLLDTYYHSNGEKTTNTGKAFKINDLRDYASELYQFYRKHLDLIRYKGGIKVGVEWAGAGTQLRKDLNELSKLNGTYPLIRFVKCEKLPVEDRVRYDRRLMANEMYYIVKDAKYKGQDILPEYEQVKWKTSITAENGITNAIDDNSWVNHIWDANCYDTEHTKLDPDFKWSKKIIIREMEE